MIEDESVCRDDSICHSNDLIVLEALSPHPLVLGRRHVGTGCRLLWKV